MRKNNVRWILLTILVIASVSMFFIFQTKSTERVSVQGIESFSVEAREPGTYLLYYPADDRVSQPHTVVKEVTKSGEVLGEYEIKDEDFRRMSVHQKPTDPDILYISLFGEATIDNYYYTYHLKNRTFTKVNVDYEQHEVGVDHIMHYGSDTLFQTLVSHKTGEQNMKVETNEFNVSLSNYSTQQSFETEYGRAPKWSPLLQFQNKVIYGTSGQVNKDNDYENAGIGIVDVEKQTVQYELPKEASDLTPIYATSEYAYILGDEGKLFVYNKDFHYEIFEPFTGMTSDDLFYSEDSPPLLLDEKRALYQVQSATKGSIVGILTFDVEPHFKTLTDFDSNSYYRFLYQDVLRNEIYIVKRNEKEESVLVIDNETLKVKEEIPVENSHLLDFVVSPT
ncbi:hypothetical protein [Bacillus sp. CGMCC 1.16541]|uniref:hypothetical protein n=1 Tax=Bacillus sp. CGMCC 1.16541 TaxID=2185143 RepID=UPI000D73E0EB|nr:hypothetical protein [Bacillus sp. CGMCC 1.16541]